MKYFRHHIRSVIASPKAVVIASPKGAAIQRVIAPARRSFSEGGRPTAAAILFFAIVAGVFFLRSAHASYITTATTAGNIAIGTNHLVGDV